MNLLLVRDTFTTKSTGGKLYIDGKFFCYTLEDVIRGEGIKIYGETGIPAGEYKVQLTESSRFKRLMPMVYTEDNGYEVIKNGISFKGIRMHGGNTSVDSHGCILIAHNRINEDTIQGTAEKDLVSELRPYTDIKLLIKNL